MARQLYGDGSPDVATSLNNLALLYHAMGNFAEALPRYEQALALYRRALGEDHPNVATSLNNLAGLYHTMGNFAEALPRYEQALEISRRALGEDHPDVATSLNNLAALYAATGQVRKSRELMEQALAIDAQMIGQIFSTGTDDQRLAYLRMLQGHVDSFLSLLLRDFSKDPAAAGAALELVLRRKAIGAEALAAQRDAVLGGSYPELAPRLQKLTILRRQIAQAILPAILARPRPAGFTIPQEQVARWTAEKEDLETELARQIPEMRLEQRLRTVDRQVVALALPHDATLVEFVRMHVFDFQAVPARGEPQWQPPRYIAFILRSGAPDNVQMIDLGEAEPIDQMIATYRDYLTSDTDAGRGPESLTSSGQAQGTDLRQALFDPIARALPKDCRDLFLAPDGALTQLPFEVLPLDDGRYLIDTMRLSYLSAGRDVLRFNVDSLIEPSAPLIAADPNFDLAGRGTPAADAQEEEQENLRAKSVLARRSRDLERGGGTCISGVCLAPLWKATVLPRCSGCLPCWPAPYWKVC